MWYVRLFVGVSCIEGVTQFTNWNPLFIGLEKKSKPRPPQFFFLHGWGKLAPKDALTLEKTEVENKGSNRSLFLGCGKRRLKWLQRAPGFVMSPLQMPRYLIISKVYTLYNSWNVLRMIEILYFLCLTRRFLQLFSIVSVIQHVLHVCYMYRFTIKHV